MPQPSVAIVTGASGGLGRSFAVELSHMRTAVVAVARRERELEETAALIVNAGGVCETIVDDVTRPGSAEDAVRCAEAAFGPVDLLVSNAGAIGFAFIERADPDTWRRCFEVNVLAPMQWAKAVMPSMRRRGPGRIINVSSLAAVASAPSFGAYCASKAALDQLTACLASEVARATSGTAFDGTSQHRRLAERSAFLGITSATAATPFSASGRSGCRAFRPRRVRRRRPGARSRW